MKDTIARYGACFSLGFAIATAICVLVIGRWKALYWDAEFLASSCQAERRQAREDAEKCWTRYYSECRVQP